MSKRFRELISGERQGFAASLMRSALRAAETPYTLAVKLRNRRYDENDSLATKVDATVISVGNITTGGTGKTPLVAWLAEWFLNRERNVGLVSRGYGSRDGAPNDEARELALRLPTTPHIQNPDRVAAANEAIAEHQTDLVILDDAFQHRRIHRDLNILLIDAVCPFGYGRLLPRGLLREPLQGMERADAIILSRADMVSTERGTEIKREAFSYNDNATWAEVIHAPEKLCNASGDAREISSLAGQRVVAFCGLGNPIGFQHTLQSCSYEVAAFKEYPDHHEYTATDLEEIAAWAAAENADVVLCTMKDLVKCQTEKLGECPLWALQIGIQFKAGEESFSQLLEAVSK